MKHTLTASLLAAACLTGTQARGANWTAGMKEGAPDIQSVSQLTFGPDGILFVADSKSVAVWAIATGDTKPGSGAIKISGVNEKVAAMLGTSADQIIIDDLAVNPVSHSAYLAVSRGRSASSTPVIVRADSSGKLTAVSLDKVKYSKAELPDAPADGAAQGKGKGSPRQDSITDIAFLEDRLLIAGMSKEEFASTLRAIPFPFKAVPNGTSVEIYHGAHGRWETRSPVRTFVPFNIGKQPHLLAAYQCTPLVQFPIKNLTPGAKIQGKTIAELGNRNRPLDMIVYQKGGKDYLLIANSSRGIMKVTTDSIEGTNGIETKIGDTAGLKYETISSWTDIAQLDRLDDQNALVVRTAGGQVSLESIPLP